MADLLSQLDIIGNTDSRQRAMQRLLESWIKEEKDMDFSFVEGDMVVISATAATHVEEATGLKRTEFPKGVFISDLLRDASIVFIKNISPMLDMLDKHSTLTV